MSLLLHPVTITALGGIKSAPLAGSVVFYGRRGLGKASAARDLAAKLNCLGDVPLDCANCRQIAAGNFPDLLWLDRGDKASLGIEPVRRLITELALRPYRAGGTRVVVVDQAHLLTVEAQNALLKLLEEPPPATVIVLISEHLEALLITVRSRCRSVHFVRPGEAAVAALLTTSHGQTGPAAAAIAAASDGAPGVAVSLAANPAEAEALASLTAGAQLPGESSLFERLLLAARLAAAGTDLDRFGQLLQRRILTGLQQSELEPAAAAAWLGALERFRLQLRAKVSPRVALERLMLELG